MQDQKPAQRGQGLKQDGDGAAKVVTAITPGHGTHALRLGHAALLQRDLRGRGQEPRCRAVAHQADAGPARAPKLLFRRHDKVGTETCLPRFFRAIWFKLL